VLDSEAKVFFNAPCLDLFDSESDSSAFGDLGTDSDAELVEVP
jgi:hypothetical protein